MLISPSPVPAVAAAPIETHVWDSSFPRCCMSTSAPSLFSLQIGTCTCSCRWPAMCSSNSDFCNLSYSSPLPLLSVDFLSSTSSTNLSRLLTVCIQTWNCTNLYCNTHHTQQQASARPTKTTYTPSTCLHSPSLSSNKPQARPSPAPALPRLFAPPSSTKMTSHP